MIVVAGIVRLKVLIVSLLRQGVVIGHAHLVPGFAYIQAALWRVRCNK